MTQLDKFNSQFKVQVRFPLAWGDMDAFNHINNTKYFKYFESARIEYFFQLGVMETERAKQIAPILAETSCRFKWPLTFPDTVIAGAAVSEIHSHGFMMDYAVYSEKHEKITSIGSGRIVMLDYSTHQKVAVGDDLVAQIEALEQTKVIKK